MNVKFCGFRSKWGTRASREAERVEQPDVCVHAQTSISILTSRDRGSFCPGASSFAVFAHWLALNVLLPTS